MIFKKFPKLVTPVLLNIYNSYIEPSSKDEDSARRQFIFNILITSLLLLTVIGFLISLTRYITHTQGANQVSPIILIIPSIILIILYSLSRKKFSDWILYVFITLYLLLGTYSLYLYSYMMPQGLLVYVLVIIISGILLSSKAALAMTLIIIINLCGLAYMQEKGITEPYTLGLYEPANRNLIIYIVMFLIILIVSWLSNREIIKSLERARRMEKLLRKERDNLEKKVKVRTRELEKAQIEKSLELYRFAEFGRFASSFLHDLANPLTAVSINLSEIKETKNLPQMAHMRLGVEYMEQYIQSARNQLRSHTESQHFDSKNEIEKVISFLTTKARDNNVSLKASLTKKAKIYGDRSKFSQVMANLIANAIDAYKDSKSKNNEVLIMSQMSVEGSTIQITVKDKGVGIKKSEINRIFEPFYTTKKNDRGTGIGLTITRDIVKKDFSGRLKVTSKQKEGTVFFIEIPITSK